jgi:hypothetical protein
MTKPERVAPADLDEAIKEGIERAEESNELTQDDLDGAAGGIMSDTAGFVERDKILY